MNKLLFALTIVFVTTTICAADIVIYADTAGLGTFGNAGTASDPLIPGERIYVDILLNRNPHPTNPSYDGYLLSMFDVDMQVTGPGTLGMDSIRTWHPNLTLTLDSSLSVSNNGIDEISAVSWYGVAGDAALVSGIWVECVNFGQIVVDLSLGGLTQYAPYNIGYTGPGTYPQGGWIDVTDPQIGDLILGDIIVYGTVPEPATMVLFALGALALRKRQ
jgi:hypothetical protein